MKVVTGCLRLTKDNILQRHIQHHLQHHHQNRLPKYYLSGWERQNKENNETKDNTQNLDNFVEYLVPLYYAFD